jgi:O-antigen/teichoic acid export membrane protein
MNIGRKMNMTILHSLAGMGLFAFALWLTLFFPYRFNNYFVDVYGYKAWSVGAAVVQAVVTIYAMFTNDGRGNSLAWIIVIIVYATCLIRCYQIAKVHNAAKSDAIKAVFSQIFAPF